MKYKDIYIDGDIKFKESTIKMLNDLQVQYNELLFCNNKLLDLLKNYDAKLMFKEGFLRRLTRLKDNILRIYEIYPFYDYPTLLSHDKHSILELSIENFIINIVGCLDNLALIWKYEKDINIDDIKVSFFKKDFIKVSNLSDNFKNMLSTEFKSKYDTYLKIFRDDIAHQIPVYIPKHILDNDLQNFKNMQDKESKLREDYFNNLDKIDLIMDEEKKLYKTGNFILTRSFKTEDAKGFHGQIISDWNMIIKIYTNFVKEFGIDIDEKIYGFLKIQKDMSEKYGINL